jgi:hypothetical protein
MIGDIKTASTSRKVAVSIGLGVLVAVAFFVIGDSYPLPVMIGAFPGPMAAALALGTALAVIAVLSPPGSRKPALSMPVADLFRLVAWWVGVAVALALVASAAWRVWGVVFFLAAIVATVKALSVISYFKQQYEFRLWLPFAAIFGIVASMIAVGLFVARSNIPPPISAALSAYRLAPGTAEPASRTAPDLSTVGFTLDLGSDVDLGGLPTTFFSYHAQDGTRVDVYEADYGFPVPPGSSGLSETPGWWVKMGDLHLLGGAAGTEFMVVGPKRRVVIGVAQALHAG